jgi:hypothetical protein
VWSSTKLNTETQFILDFWNTFKSIIIQYYLYSWKWINSPKYIEFLLINVQFCVLFFVYTSTYPATHKYSFWLSGHLGGYSCYPLNLCCQYPFNRLEKNQIVSHQRKLLRAHTWVYHASRAPSEPSLIQQNSDSKYKWLIFI